MTKFHAEKRDVAHFAALDISLKQIQLKHTRILVAISSDLQFNLQFQASQISTTCRHLNNRFNIKR